MSDNNGVRKCLHL